MQADALTAISQRRVLRAAATASPGNLLEGALSGSGPSPPSPQAPRVCRCWGTLKTCAAGAPTVRGARSRWSSSALHVSIPPRAGACRGWKECRQDSLRQKDSAACLKGRAAPPAALLTQLPVLPSQTFRFQVRLLPLASTL
ncbi:hypothetical protein mRhiFer1_009535 [Rhinolophus ferrumequinum]|uniref:Uncharacterized protein n=1 Tax=Rhinolophus ferrumequinum TaxID=59479 RepID=A0A7J7R8H4_RHIFE|nr:hypothetical protein mRhiFer1_009535 [Rhinolophus ferrumequinum]